MTNDLSLILNAATQSRVPISNCGTTVETPISVTDVVTVLERLVDTLLKAEVIGLNVKIVNSRVITVWETLLETLLRHLIQSEEDIQLCVEFLKQYSEQ